MLYLLLVTISLGFKPKEATSVEIILICKVKWMKLNLIYIVNKQLEVFMPMFKVNICFYANV